MLNTRINFWLILEGPYKLEKRKSFFYKVECTLCNKIYNRELYAIKKTISCKCRHALPKVSSRLQNIYNLMKQRCKGNMKFNGGKTYYHDKGIDVCEIWKNNPREFYKWAEISGYSEDLQLDRIDNNLGYNPDNCRWVSVTFQQRNKSSNVLNVELVKKIKKDLTFMRNCEVAKKYCISTSLISQIKKNKIWVDVCI